MQHSFVVLHSADSQTMHRVLRGAICISSPSSMGSLWTSIAIYTDVISNTMEPHVYPHTLITAYGMPNFVADHHTDDVHSFVSLAVMCIGLKRPLQILCIKAGPEVSSLMPFSLHLLTSKVSMLPSRKDNGRNCIWLTYHLKSCMVYAGVF